MITSPRYIAGILAVFLLILLSFAANAAVFYVKTTGDNGNTGLSWSQAKRTIGSAMSAAAYYDQVWVAAGTYNERVDLKAGVRMYGGFTGTETSLEQRDWRANLTVIDGGNGGSVIKIRNGPNDLDSRGRVRHTQWHRNQRLIPERCETWWWDLHG